ncbi:hypothetical protein CVT25_003463 [Psilocybe cyanescens]|uniref:Uncharacterized protein n=1 Tax=Psilocybe cyanescens TaxID=93625 RepID=A0A409X532_PSICY|nr:hypothetical protein CVT25_003463 [Psilocybe cyanescens]
MANWQSSNTPKPYPAVVPSLGPSQQQQQQEAPPPYTSPPVYPNSQPRVEYAIIIPRPGAGQRFISAFFVATFIWMLLSLLVQSTVNALQFGHRHRGRSNDCSFNLRVQVGDYSIPSEMHSNTCVEGTEWNQTGQTRPSFLGINYGTSAHALGFTSFTLPISSDVLFFVSRGQNLGGSLEVVTSPNQAAQSATVNVQVTSSSEDALQQTMACLLTRNANQNGVGIFTPIDRYPAWWNSNFHITVILPETGDNASLHIKDFETDLPNSSHQIGDLGRKVIFDAISLSGSNGPISVQSLATYAGKINTGNGKISGVFNATQSLLLSTTNSAINVDVGLTSQEGGSRPTLTTRTSNGLKSNTDTNLVKPSPTSAIDANISLFSTSGSGGSFVVTAQTSNQPLQIAFPTSPSGSALNLQASTENAPASVLLDDAYAGSFDLRTSAYEDATVNVVRPNVSGRHVRYSGEGRGETAGSVVWDGGNYSANGRVSVSTSNGRVELEL